MSEDHDENAFGRRDISSRWRTGERRENSTFSAPQRSLMRQLEDLEAGDTMDGQTAPQDTGCRLRHGDVPQQLLPCIGGLMGCFRRVSAHAQSAFAPTTTQNPSEMEQFSILEDPSYSTPIKEAKTFILSGERGSYPSISFNEIVLPGSEMQRAMAKQMMMDMDLMEESDQDECVICMEGFSPDNPRMPTLCGCGENKTYFHLPCLYQWIDQASRHCPSCRQKLIWEEF
eukprot:CAMPEP_0172415952 /NCGR_PEP_ID=MMETSP1064-20121228/2377_1 /TAXON_ID=202472 /ORGANISM="Aulacoseira subarctica , Strain CCAP 1002/5" /LENGTH=228 /DNA_ID=CAMNT_0013153255 /DNA_START=171 /DNA_END=857 /DNA_ORIENTATION=-